MMNVLFASIVAIHGLIHLLGFVKEWDLVKVTELTGKTLVPLSSRMARTLGLLWLAACLLFIAAAAVFLLDKEWWWMIAAVTVAMSQVLIVIYWRDAKFGTIANVVILIGCILSYGTWSFNRMVSEELRAFRPVSDSGKHLVSKEDVSQLPTVVQRWLERSHIIGKETISTAHLRQRGEMRTSPDGNWMAVDAEQYFTVEKPGFVWIADVEAAPFVHLAGRDMYQDGRGHMLIKLLSLFPVADARGAAIDQGTLVRFLAEIVWFPSAALCSYLTWETVDSTSARAIMTYGGVTDSGMFRFDANGDVASFEAQRYYDSKEGATLETWHITLDGNSYKEFEGIRIPAKAAATWKLKAGDFTWYRQEVTEATYKEGQK